MVFTTGHVPSRPPETIQAMKCYFFYKKKNEGTAVKERPLGTGVRHLNDARFTWEGGCNVPAVPRTAHHSESVGRVFVDSMDTVERGVSMV